MDDSGRGETRRVLYVVPDAWERAAAQYWTRDLLPTEEGA
jgi:hypothetical protein